MAQLFADTWTPTGFSFTLDNDEFTAPDDAPWARFAIRHNAGTQDTLGRTGNRKFLRLGSAFVQIFTRSNTGTRQSKQLAQTIVNGFEGARIAGTTIRFNDVIVRESGVDGKWYLTVVEATFEYDETR